MFLNNHIDKPLLNIYYHILGNFPIDVHYSGRERSKLYLYNIRF